MRTILVALVALVGCSASAPKHRMENDCIDCGRQVARLPPAPDPTLTPPTFRLPGDVVPVRYRLEQTIVPDRDRVEGDISIDATVKTETRAVWLNAKGLVIRAAEINGQRARILPGGDDFVGIQPLVSRDDSPYPELGPTSLLPGPIVIHVAYDATIDRDKSRGIYSEREGDEPYVYTFFEAIDARRAFPCFDEPAYKVPWTLTFHVRKSDIVRGNAPVVRELDQANGMKVVQLAESKPLPSYLVAFVVGPFDVIDDGVAGRAKTPVQFIVPKGRAGELAYAKAITPKVVAALEDYFDMNYPYGKLDVAVVPRFWGTMEHPGIVAMGQPLTLIRPDQATRSRKQSYTNILAHELSHYWFGDYVTMAWWDDVWLNESLGEWSDMNITDAVAPEWHYRDERVALARASMRADETLAAKPIHHDVTTPEDIEAAFDNGIVYGKGSSVLRATEALVGPERFREFIRAYVRAHAWGNATANDFLGELRKALGDQAGDMMQGYVDRPGLPVVQVHAECSAPPPAGTAPMTPRIVVEEARRALPAGVTDPAPAPWRIPVCVRYGDATHSERACGVDTIAVARCPAWILPNADANGYYRSVVDVTPPAAAAKASVAERMMWFADLRAMVERGETSIDHVLAAIPALLRDPNPRIARWAMEASDLRFDGLDEKLYQAARAWQLKTFGPRARELGWQRKSTDDDERHRLRLSLLWTVGRRDPVLRGQAEKLADKWLADRTGVDDDLVDGVLASATGTADVARFERMLAVAKAPRDRSERQRVLTALGAYIDPTLAKRALALTLDPAFDLRESIRLLEVSLQQHETRDLALAFVSEHIDELLAHMRSDEAGWFLDHLSRSACDPERRAKIAALVTPRAAKFDGAQNAVAQGLEQADRCIAETARDLPAFRKFFGPPPDKWMKVKR